MRSDQQLDDIAHKRAERHHWKTQNFVQRGTFIVASIALLAAIASACFSYQQAEVASRALTEVQRAFIVVDDIKIEKINEKDDGKWDIKIKIRNSGSTPTRNLSYFIPMGGMVFFGQNRPKINDVELPNVPSDPAFTFYATGHGNVGDRSFAVVGPGGDLRINSIDFRINSFMKHKDKLNLEKVAVVGAIIYNDIFHYSPRHITKFCYFIYPETGKIEECGFWNCADKECERDAEAYNDALKACFKNVGKSVPDAMLARMDWLQSSERLDIP